ncbi:MAG TPA: TorF family putative porin [Pseudolabrys sp.]|nr:TorF family putative porin [Pseudolabrys sp.]
MKKVVLSVVAALAITAAAPALAADMPVKAKPVVPAAAPSPWDVAFGAAFTSDYVLRGVSQSNHKPAGQGYFEVDYTATDWLKLYAGVWGSSLWTGFADAEFDFTGGARLTFGNFGLDLGVIYYYYPGGINSSVVPPLSNGSYVEAYAKPSYKFNDWLTVGGVFETGFNNYNNKAVAPGLVWVGDAGHYFAAGNAVITLPWHPVADVTLSINPEIGYEWYSSGVTANMGFISDTYWDVGLDIVYKAVTLDLRYWGTNAKPGIAGTASANQCNTAVGSGGSSNLCGDRFVATLKFDTTLSALK